METILLKSTEVTFEDLVFENRNKAYGAYFLRNRYSRYLIIAFLLTLIVASLIIIIPFARALKDFGQGIHEEITRTVVITPITTENIANQLHVPSLPKFPPPKSITDQPKYQAPKLVSETHQGDQIDPNTNLANTIVNQPIIQTLVSDTIISAAIPDEPKDTLIFNPQEQASFMDGDVNTFRMWVQKNLVYPSEAIQNGIDGKFYVQFCINYKGDIVDIIISSKANPVLAAEANRVLKLSPKWRPAKQGGQPVKQHFAIPLIFKISS